MQYNCVNCMHRGTYVAANPCFSCAKGHIHGTNFASNKQTATQDYKSITKEEEIQKFNWKPNTGPEHLYKSGLCIHCLWPYNQEADVCKKCELGVSHADKLKMETLRDNLHKTEADPTGRKPSDPGAKLDAGKPKAALLRQVGLALLEVAKVLTIGAKKYSKNGWLDVPDGEERYDDAFWRHILYGATEAVDKDTGLPHDVQEVVNGLFKLELRLRREKAHERNESSNN